MNKKISRDDLVIKKHLDDSSGKNQHPLLLVYGTHTALDYPKYYAYAQNICFQLLKSFLIPAVLFNLFQDQLLRTSTLTKVASFGFLCTLLLKDMGKHAKGLKYIMGACDFYGAVSVLNIFAYFSCFSLMCICAATSNVANKVRQATVHDFSAEVSWAAVVYNPHQAHYDAAFLISLIDSIHSGDLLAKFWSITHTGIFHCEIPQAA